MSLFDKLKAAVKGNAVIKEYHLDHQIGSYGPGLLWRVYHGTKRSTNKPVSVFVLDKKCSAIEKLSKREKEMLMEALKLGPAQLSRLRHPRLLTVDHPLEESNDVLAFTTEPVVGCLANVLGNHKNFAGSVPFEIKDMKLSELEIKYGILQISQGLAFVHNEANLLHGCLAPECIFISSSGHWKLAGFEFSLSLGDSSELQVRARDSKLNSLCQPSLNFIAPEYILTKLASRCSDVFSFAMLICASFNHGRPLYDHRGNLSEYNRNIEWVSRIPYQSMEGVPESLKETVKTMLCIEPSVRPEAQTLATSDYFASDVNISTLIYLDNLYDKPELDKSQFFKTLPKILPQFPKNLLMQFVLPSITAEFVDKRMIPFVLPSVFLIAGDLNSNEYMLHVFPSISPLFRVQEPIQVPLILLQHMDLLLQKTPPTEIKEHVIPMIQESIESTSIKVQELCIVILPNFAEMLDFTSLNKTIITKLLAILKSSNSLGVRVKVLVSLGKILNILDKNVVLNQVLPHMETVHSKEPAILMSILGIYHTVFHTKRFLVDRQYIASTMLPFLIPLSLEQTLNVHQYGQFTQLIHEMMERVEAEQKTHLDQLNKMAEQTMSTVALSQDVKNFQTQQGSPISSSFSEATKIPSNEDEPLKPAATVTPIFQSMDMNAVSKQMPPQTKKTAPVEYVNETSQPLLYNKPKPEDKETVKSATSVSNNLFSGMDVPRSAHQPMTSTSQQMSSKLTSIPKSTVNKSVTSQPAVASQQPMKSTVLQPATSQQPVTTNVPPSSQSSERMMSSLSSQQQTSMLQPMSSQQQTSMLQPMSSQQQTSMLKPMSSQQQTSMLQPMSSQQQTSMLQPMSSQQQTSMLQPMSSQQQTSMLQPMSSQQQTSMFQPMSSQQQTSMLQPMSSQQQTSMFQPMSSQQFAGVQQSQISFMQDSPTTAFPSNNNQGVFNTAPQTQYPGQSSSPFIDSRQGNFNVGYVGYPQAVPSNLTAQPPQSALSRKDLEDLLN